MTTIERVRPVPGESPAWRFPQADRFTLPSGLNVVACHLPSRPILDIRLVVEGGTESERPAEAGLASIAARALVDGTALRSGPSFNESLELLGGHIHTRAQLRAMTVNISTPQRNAISGLELLTELVATPGLRDDDIAKKIRQRVDETAFENMMPQASGANALMAAVFEAGSRATMPQLGTRETVESITPDAVRAWWGELVGPHSSTLIVTGDLADIDIQRAVEKSLGQWAGNGTAARQTPASLASSTAATVVVDHPQSVQTNLFIGLASEGVDYDDLAALRAAGTVLGGYFGSRLMTKLREEKNITYTAGASFQTSGSTGRFVAMTAVDAPATAEACETILEEISTFGDTLTELELRRATDFLIRQGPTAFKTVEAVAGTLESIATEAYPDNHVDLMRERLAALTPDDVASAYRRYVDPGRVCVAAAGSAAKIADGLRELRGDVRVEAAQLDIASLVASAQGGVPAQLAGLLASLGAKAVPQGQAAAQSSPGAQPPK